MATKLYVVTHPASIRGIYATWPECAAAVRGVSGARFQAVSSRELAEAMLRGEPVVLPPGRYAFVDGNHMGGIGVVLVEADPGPGEPRTVREVATTVYDVFGPAGLASLDSRSTITAAANRLRNVLAELGGSSRRSSWPPPASRSPSSTTTKASAPGSRGAGRPRTRWWPRSSPPAAPGSPTGASP